MMGFGKGKFFILVLSLSELGAMPPSRINRVSCVVRVIDSCSTHASIVDHLLHLLGDPEQVVVLSEVRVDLDRAGELVG